MSTAEAIDILIEEFSLDPAEVWGDIVKEAALKNITVDHYLAEFWL